jgi:hypothetical protein
MMAELIMKLRRASSTRPFFQDRVVGVADASRAATYTALSFPACYVCFLSEDADAQSPGANENQQRVTQRWGVIVGLEATNDIRGQDPTQQIDSVRVALFRALYNWSPNYNPDPFTRLQYRYGNLWYDGCKLLDVNRAVTYWLFTFGTFYWVCSAEGEEEEQFDPLPDYKGFNIHIDWKKPHDPGEPPSEEYDPRRGPAPWPTGPEGRIEQEIRYDQVNNEDPPRRQ